MQKDYLLVTQKLTKTFKKEYTVDALSFQFRKITFMDC